MPSSRTLRASFEEGCASAASTTLSSCAIDLGRRKDDLVLRVELVVHGGLRHPEPRSAIICKDVPATPCCNSSSATAMVRC